MGNYFGTGIRKEQLEDEKGETGMGKHSIDDCHCYKRLADCMKKPKTAFIICFISVILLPSVLTVVNIRIVQQINPYVYAKKNDVDQLVASMREVKTFITDVKTIPTNVALLDGCVDRNTSDIKETRDNITRIDRIQQQLIQNDKAVDNRLSAIEGKLDTLIGVIMDLSRRQKIDISAENNTTKDGV